MTSSLSTVSYIGATILFILCLGGLSNPETSRRGNLYGIIGMAIAVLATVFGPQVTAAGTSLHPRRDGGRRRAWASTRRASSR
jgi:NAD(P) transhydrogenase subunit beta